MIELVVHVIANLFWFAFVVYFILRFFRMENRLDKLEEKVKNLDR